MTLCIPEGSEVPCRAMPEKATADAEQKTTNAAQVADGVHACLACLHITELNGRTRLHRQDGQIKPLEPREEKMRQETLLNL